MQKPGFVFSMLLDPCRANFSVYIRFLPPGSSGKHSPEISGEIVAQLKNSGAMSLL
jgi:hypothetical protein